MIEIWLHGMLSSGFDDEVTGYQGPRIFKQMLVEGLKPDMNTTTPFAALQETLPASPMLRLGNKFKLTL